MAVIDFPPGVVNVRSRKRGTGNWREVNLVRWENSTMKPIAGWEKVNYPAFASPLRAIHNWSTLGGKSCTAFLCELHCYVDIDDGVLIDITPVDGLVPVPMPLEGGYGDEEYGTDEYGMPRAYQARNLLATPCFTLDNWGEELRAMTSSDGRYLRWDPNTPTTRLTRVANSPLRNRTFMITPERFAMLFGVDADDSRLSWSDQENDTVWAVSTDNKSGGYNISPFSPIVNALKAPNGILVFTNRAAYLVSFVGLPYVYSYSEITEAQCPYSPQSAVRIPQGLMWAAPNGFWLFNGVSIEPVGCPVWDWVADSVDFHSTRYFGSMIAVPTRFEVWWFFSTGSMKNDRFVVYNYETQVWSMGKLGRNCGASSANNYSPLMSDGISVYKHEVGFAYPGAPELPWAESYSLNLENGLVLTTVMQMLPEFIGNAADVQFEFVKNNNATKNVETVSARKKIRDNGFVDVRETARDFRMRVVAVEGSDWTLGPISVDIRTRGLK